MRQREYLCVKNLTALLYLQWKWSLFVSEQTKSKHHHYAKTYAKMTVCGLLLLNTENQPAVCIQQKNRVVRSKYIDTTTETGVEKFQVWLWRLRVLLILTKHREKILAFKKLTLMFTPEWLKLQSLWKVVSCNSPEMGIWIVPVSGKVWSKSIIYLVNE